MCEVTHESLFLCLINDGSVIKNLATEKIFYRWLCTIPIIGKNQKRISFFLKSWWISKQKKRIFAKTSTIINWSHWWLTDEQK